MLVEAEEANHAKSHLPLFEAYRAIVRATLPPSGVSPAVLHVRLARTLWIVGTELVLDIVGSRIRNRPKRPVVLVLVLVQTPPAPLRPSAPRPLSTRERLLLASLSCGFSVSLFFLPSFLSPRPGPPFLPPPFLFLLLGDGLRSS